MKNLFLSFVFFMAVLSGLSTAHAAVTCPEPQNYNIGWYREGFETGFARIMWNDYVLQQRNCDPKAAFENWLLPLAAKKSNKWHATAGYLKTDGFLGSWPLEPYWEDYQNGFVSINITKDTQGDKYSFVLVPDTYARRDYYPGSAEIDFNDLSNTEVKCIEFEVNAATPRYNWVTGIQFKKYDGKTWKSIELWSHRETNHPEKGQEVVITELNKSCMRRQTHAIDWN